jgi:hypothetical protein
VDLERNAAADAPKRLARPVPRDAAAQRVELARECMHPLADLAGSIVGAPRIGRGTDVDVTRGGVDPHAGRIS